MTARGSPGRRKKSALWTEIVGQHGSRIKVGERTLGGTVFLFVYDAAINGPRRENLGFRVRDPEGRLIKERCTKAKRAAVDRVARRIDGELPGATATLDRVIDVFRREVLPTQGVKQQVETRREL